MAVLPENHPGRSKKNSLLQRFAMIRSCYWKGRESGCREILNAAV